MRGVIIKLLSFLFIIVVIDFTVGKIMDAVLIGTQKGDWGRNNYIANELKSDVLILGSSRAIHHYDPIIFEDSLGLTCYNCGEDGMGIILMYARYKLVCERIIPSIVVYDFISEFDYEIDRDDIKYLKFLRPLKRNPVVDSIINKISMVERFKLFSNLYTYNSVYLDIVSQFRSKSPSLARKYTYAPLTGMMSYVPQVENENDNFYTEDSIKVYYMNKLIQDCKTNGTKLFFVLSPRYGGYDTNSNSWLSDLCLRHSIPIYNHYSDLSFCENQEMFNDSYHLNKIGAEAFTSRVAHEILSDNIFATAPN